MGWLLLTAASGLLSARAASFVKTYPWHGPGRLSDRPSRTHDAWPCLPDLATPGPEVATVVLVPKSGFLSARLTAVEDDAELAVIIAPLTDHDCIIGGRELAGAWLPGGWYRVYVDSVRPGLTGYVLSLGLTIPADLAPFGLDPDVATSALQAAERAWEVEPPARTTLGIIDFSRRSDEDRLWVLDLATGELLHQMPVSHGTRSGSSQDRARAVTFSNTPNSRQSSLGLMRAAETYVGKHGRSMRLDGLEPGFNDLARHREIVFHGATYARPDHVATYGYLGRSWGCPAVDDRSAQAVIDDLFDGGLLWTWYPQPEWLAGSEYLTR